MSMREEFEAWFFGKKGITELGADNNPYASSHAQAAWWAWQASRDAVVIELPEPAQSAILALIAEVEALREERKGKALVPIEPSPGLLMRMAIRNNHGLGIPRYYDQPLLIKANHGVTHARLLQRAISEMRKIHDEVVGDGFYSAERDSCYAAIADQ